MKTDKIKTTSYILLLVFLIIHLFTFVSFAKKTVWQRRTGHNVEIHHKLQHERVTPDMWPDEPESPNEIDNNKFTEALLKLCNPKSLPLNRAQKFSSAILEDAAIFKIDPFITAALIYDQSRCLPKTPDSEDRYGLSRIDVKMHSPHIRGGKYIYYILEDENWVQRSLDTPKYPFNKWKAANPISNIYWTSAILGVFKDQHDSLDKLFSEVKHRHYVSHWFFGDNVQNSEPEERVLTFRRVLLDYYYDNKPVVAGEFNETEILSPLSGTPRLVLDDFNVQRGTKKKGHIHQGVDLTAEMDEQIFAMADGIVVFAGTDLPGAGSKELSIEESEKFPQNKMGNGGLYIAINHGNGFRTYYMHMDTIAVETRAKVKAGELIGTVGRSGSTQSGAHLHLEFRIGKERVDPAQYMQNILVDPKRIISGHQNMENQE
ncbi:MAG: M23 family metallopeptidase [Deltaproteobacteria bacterium]|nr:M23 family metallopeptidase [Deltaproteobacteria bacterium]